MDFIAGLGGTHGLENVTIGLGKIRKEAGGFLGQSVVRSYAYPSKFTVLGQWGSAEEAWAFGASDVLLSLIDGMPGPAPIELVRFEGYDTVIETDGARIPISDARFEQFADWTLSSISKAADYLQSRKELFALQQTHNPGFVTARLYRSAGIPTKFLMHTIFKDKATAQAGGSAPELREFVSSHPASNYANVSPSIEAYAVVHRL
jgi:heme-degrading monooxygenase HmoA